mmetsp:Transcript_23334/g.36502  ORF Transcript_23334/g.36502 Transcript_23334/m.36502 type:complete len:263 (+) Transcript_23334:1668-2456(+)
MITPGPRVNKKSLKSRYLANMFPMMIFGGSPIMVAVPPTLEKIASEIRKGRGSMFTSLHSLQVTGAISKMVVTLSKKAERTAVTKQSSKHSLVLSPPESLQARTPVHSNTPVLMVIPTISIIPHKRPRVPWSIHPTALEREGARFCMARTTKQQAAPIIAAIVLCMASVVMNPKTMHMMTAAMITWLGPVEPRPCSCTATAMGASRSLKMTMNWSRGSSKRLNSKIRACSSSRISYSPKRSGLPYESSSNAAKLLLVLCQLA